MSTYEISRVELTEILNTFHDDITNRWILGKQYDSDYSEYLKGVLNQAVEAILKVIQEEEKGDNK